MTYFAPPISFMREAKKCFKNSQKEEIQNSKGWSYQKSVMVPMDRVQLSEDYQMLRPPVYTNLINTRRMNGLVILGATSWF